MAYPGIFRGRAFLRPYLESFLNGILMRATKCADDELATIWCSGMDWDLVANFYDIDDPVQIREVDIRVNTLRIEVQGEGNEINISSSLTIPKETTFHSICTSHLCQLRSRNGTTHDHYADEEKRKSSHAPRYSCRNTRSDPRKRWV